MTKTYQPAETRNEDREHHLAERGLGIRAERHYEAPARAKQPTIRDSLYQECDKGRGTVSFPTN